MQRKDRFTTIDPGVNQTAYSHWERIRKTIRGACPHNFMISTGSVSTKEDTDIKKQFSISDKIRDEVIKFGSTTIYIEGVNLAREDEIAKISKRKGDLVKLSYLVGGLILWFHEISIDVIILPFSEWAGNLTDEAIKYQVGKILPKHVTESTHKNDCLGMGLYTIGSFGERKPGRKKR